MSRGLSVSPLLPLRIWLRHLLISWKKTDSCTDPFLCSIPAIIGGIAGGLGVIGIICAAIAVYRSSTREIEVSPFENLGTHMVPRSGFVYANSMHKSSLGTRVDGRAGHVPTVNGKHTKPAYTIRRTRSGPSPGERVREGVSRCVYIPIPQHLFTLCLHPLDAALHGDRPRRDQHLAPSRLGETFTRTMRTTAIGWIQDDGRMESLGSVGSGRI